MAGMRAFAGTLGRFAAVGAGYVGATVGLEGTVGAARQLEAQMTELGVKTGMTDGQLAMLRQRLTALSGPTNQATADLVAGVDTMVGLGLSAEQAAGAVPAIGKAATATGSTMADLSAAATSAMQNLGVAPEHIGKLLDRMAAAGNRGAFELRDMAQYMPALGAAYQGLGQKGVDAATDLAAALQIVRTGTGDSASAATNLQNVLQKINAPQTRAAFKKMGVNLSKEMTKASKAGMTPIEALAEITNKTLKGDLSKLGDLFSDAQVQQGLRPLIQQLEEYRRIRQESANADGTIDAAFARRMQNANERIKAFQIRLGNAGTRIGAKLLGPIADAADYLVGVFDTLGERVTVFDRIGASIKGFLAGLGLNTDGGALKAIGDFIFGVQTSGAKAGEELGRLTAQFRSYGEALANNPIAKFLAEITAALAAMAMSKWARLFIVAGGIYALVNAVSGADSIGAFVENLRNLSTLELAGAGAGLLILAARAKKVIDLFRTASAVAPTAAAVGAGLATKGKGAGFGIGWNLPTILGTAAAELTRRVIEQTSAAVQAQNRQNGGRAVLSGQGDEADIANRHRQNQGQYYEAGGFHRVLSQGGPTPTAPALADPLGALRATILQTRQTGTADVRMTNPPPRPNVNVTVNQSVSLTEAPAAAAKAIADQTGRAAQQAVEGGYHDGGV